MSFKTWLLLQMTIGKLIKIKLHTILTKDTIRLLKTHNNNQEFRYNHRCNIISPLKPRTIISLVLKRASLLRPKEQESPKIHKYNKICLNLKCLQEDQFLTMTQTSQSKTISISRVLTKEYLKTKSLK